MEPMQTRIDVERSRRLARVLNVQAKDCYANGVLGLLLPGTDDGEYYVEGWVLTEIVFEHGWIELADGTLLDPTLVRTRDLEKVCYCAGERYTRSQVEAMYHLTLPWVYRDKQFGRSISAYVEVRDTAFAELLQRTQNAKRCHV
jgi:hypothetical protein